MKLTLGIFEHYCTESEDRCGGEIISRVNSVSLIRKRVFRDENGVKKGPDFKDIETALAWADKRNFEVTNR